MEKEKINAHFVPVRRRHGGFTNNQPKSLVGVTSRPITYEFGLRSVDKEKEFLSYVDRITDIFLGVTLDRIRIRNTGTSRYKLMCKISVYGESEALFRWNKNMASILTFVNEDYHSNIEYPSKTVKTDKQGGREEMNNG